jgi:hypothetical protein
VSEPVWQSLHVHYHTEDQDRLVLDAVRPLFVRLAGPVPRAYHLKHWRRGPHLRLNLHTTPETFATVVRPAVDDVVGGYLAAHPSPGGLDPAALLPVHQRLAALEQESGPLLPWCPDNSIQDAAFDARLDQLGSVEAVELLADFHVATTGLTFDMLERIAGRPAARLNLAFDLMIATAHGLTRNGITGAFMSFRSHAEAFLSSVAEGRGLRPAWDAHYAKHADALTTRVRRVVDALDGRPADVPFVTDWIGALTPIQRRGEELIAAGRLSLNAAAPDAARVRAGELSEFHTRLLANQRWRETLAADWFASYRLVLNYTYLHLTRLGVRPAERFLLGHLAANAVEQAYGVSTLARLDA